MLKSWFRNLRMKKYSSKRPTGLLPLRDIHTALALLDGTEPDCLRYSDRIEAFMQKYGIAVSFIFLDFRKIGKNTVVYACGREVMNRADIDWLGIPKGIAKWRKKSVLLKPETDLFISFIGSDDFTSRFISSAVRAGFKIGVSTYQGNPFDLVITDEGDDCPSGLPEDDSMKKSDACGNVPDTPAKIEAICNFLKRII